MKMNQFRTENHSKSMSLKDKPPRILLCHCMKCDDKWTVRMQLVPDLESIPVKRGRVQKRMIWIFPPEDFDHCNFCGAKNDKNTSDPLNRTFGIRHPKVIHSILVKTDAVGYVKLHKPGHIPDAIRLRENNLVTEE